MQGFESSSALTVLRYSLVQPSPVRSLYRGFSTAVLGSVLFRAVIRSSLSFRLPFTASHIVIQVPFVVYNWTNTAIEVKFPEWSKSNPLKVYLYPVPNRGVDRICPIHRLLQLAGGAVVFAELY